jgi:hypothetical protein
VTKIITTKIIKHGDIEKLKDHFDYSVGVFKNVLFENKLFNHDQTIKKYEQLGIIDESRRTNKGWRMYSKKEMIESVDSIKRKYKQKTKWKNRFY